MIQQSFGFYRITSSIREQRAKLSGSWDRVVRLHNGNGKIHITRLGDVVAEKQNGFVPTFGGDRLKDVGRFNTPIDAMRIGISLLHQVNVTVTNVGPYLDVTARPYEPLVTSPDFQGPEDDFSRLNY